MLGRTHIITGMGALGLLSLLPSTITTDNLAICLLGATFGALAPDLDANSSTIKHFSIARIRPFAPIAMLLSRDLGHRGATHSLMGLIVFTCLSAPAAFLHSTGLWLALVTGYASHLAGDACTVSGIPWLYPNLRRCHLLPRCWRLRTGSQAEDAVGTLIAVAVLAWLLSLLEKVPR